MSITLLYKVQVGAYKEKANAEKVASKLKKAGFNTAIIKENGYFKVQCGAFANKENADKLVSKLAKAGYSKPIIIVSKKEESTKKEETQKKETATSQGAQKVFNLMNPYIDSKTAHRDFVKEYNAFMDWYNKKHGTKHGKIGMANAWCTMFVELMFYKAGYLDLLGYGKRARDLYAIAKKNGTWKSGTSDIKFGDVVIYQDKLGIPNHTEFALGGNKFISGNYNGGVHYRTRNNLGSVKGRIRPKYPQN